MTTIFTHALIPLTTALGLGRQVISRRLMYAGMFASVLPDFDTIGLKFGVVYGSQWGHRGFSHSITMALLIGLLCAIFLHHQLHTTRLKAFVFVSLSMLSHALLDMLTSGGMGVAILWPLDNVRYFFDYRPILVSPIGGRFFTARGLKTMISEFYIVWLPALVWMVALWVLWRNRPSSARSGRRKAKSK